MASGAVNNDFLNCQYLPVIIVPEKDNCDCIRMFTDFLIFGGKGPGESTMWLPFWVRLTQFAWTFFFQMSPQWTQMDK